MTFPEMTVPPEFGEHTVKRLQECIIAPFDSGEIGPGYSVIVCDQLSGLQQDSLNTLFGRLFPDYARVDNVGFDYEVMLAYDSRDRVVTAQELTFHLERDDSADALTNRLRFQRVRRIGGDDLFLSYIDQISADNKLLAADQAFGVGFNFSGTNVTTSAVDAILGVLSIIPPRASNDFSTHYAMWQQSLFDRANKWGVVHTKTVRPVPGTRLTIAHERGMRSHAIESDPALMNWDSIHHAFLTYEQRLIGDERRPNLVSKLDIEFTLTGFNFDDKPVATASILEPVSFQNKEYQILDEDKVTLDSHLIEHLIKMIESNFMER